MEVHLYVEVGGPHPSEEGEAMAKSVASSNPWTFDDRDADCHWYAAYTICRHEKSVARHMNQREVENFLPLYRAQHRWRDGSRMELELPLFSSYIFVRIQGNDRVKVLRVPGVLSLVGAKNSQPTPLLDMEIEALRSGLDPSRAEPHPLVSVGQRVRIRIGALAGMTGIVVRKKNSLRVVLTLELLMQSIAVEVNGVDLEPLDSDCTGKRDGLKQLDNRSLQNFSSDFKCLESSSNSLQPKKSSFRYVATWNRQLE
jgi:transcription antitermination factor NusG